MAFKLKDFSSAWYEALEQSQAKEWPAISESMMIFLLKKGKISQLGRIFSLMKERAYAENGIVEVSATTAFVADEKEVHDSIKKLTGAKEVVSQISHDESLLGGMAFETKDSRWDLSLRHQLTSLQKHLEK